MARRLRINPIGVSVALHGILIAALAAQHGDTPSARRGDATIDLELVPTRIVKAESSRGSPAPDMAAKLPTPRSSIPRAARRRPRVALAHRQPTPPRDSGDPRDPGPTIATSRDPMMHMRTRGPSRPRAERVPGPRGFDLRAAARTIVPAAKPPAVTMLTPALPTARGETGLRPTGAGTYEYDDIAFKADVGADGRVRFKDKPNLQAHISPLGIGGSFDLTDWAMRAAGMDPYLRRKAKMLDRTREARVAMAASWRREALRDSVAALPGYLDRIWRYTPWSARKRRRVLFELWDESKERGTDDAARTGRTARATIVAFVRKRLPAGSANAYTPGEIKILNRRRKSRARFGPYARAAIEPNTSAP